jgi:hypothetical protein
MRALATDPLILNFSHKIARVTKDLWDFVAEFLVSTFVKEDFVVKLILDLHLGPGLLLGFTATLFSSGKGTLLVFCIAGVFTGG